MRDLHKGVILLLLALLATVIAFSVEDRRWEMAFINFEAKQQLREVEDIQAQLLAGLDPTENAQPTAAGVVSAKSQFAPCFTGKIARDFTSDEYHNAPYTSVKNAQDTFIKVNNNVYLLKSAFEMQSASLIEDFPNEISQMMQSAISAGRCVGLDLHLAKIKP